jgi:hypothetical protein
MCVKSSLYSLSLCSVFGLFSALFFSLLTLALPYALADPANSSSLERESSLCQCTSAGQRGGKYAATSTQQFPHPPYAQLCQHRLHRSTQCSALDHSNRVVQSTIQRQSSTVWYHTRSSTPHTAHRNQLRRGPLQLVLSGEDCQSRRAARQGRQG